MKNFSAFKSTLVGAIAYDGRSTLFVRFASGQTYGYNDVGPDVYENFVRSESKGRFFNAMIKGRFHGELMDWPIREIDQDESFCWSAFVGEKHKKPFDLFF